LASVLAVQVERQARSEQKREGSQPSVLYQEVEEAGMAAALLSEPILRFQEDLVEMAAVALGKQLPLEELLELALLEPRSHLVCTALSKYREGERAQHQ
jgi:hypothetical protein